MAHFHTSGQCLIQEREPPFTHRAGVYKLVIYHFYMEKTIKITAWFSKLAWELPHVRISGKEKSLHSGADDNRDNAPGCLPRPLRLEDEVTQQRSERRDVVLVTHCLFICVQALFCVLILVWFFLIVNDTFWCYHKLSVLDKLLLIL